MSRSIKKAIYKDGTGREHRQMRKIVRHSQNNFIRANFDKIANGELVIPNEKSIVNDYDYSDYTIDYEHHKNSWWGRGMTEEEKKQRKEELSRK